MSYTSPSGDQVSFSSTPAYPKCVASKVNFPEIPPLLFGGYSIQLDAGGALAPFAELASGASVSVLASGQLVQYFPGQYRISFKSHGPGYYKPLGSSVTFPESMAAPTSGAGQIILPTLQASGEGERYGNIGRGGVVLAALEAAAEGLTQINRLAGRLSPLQASGNAQARFVAGVGAIELQALTIGGTGYNGYRFSPEHVIPSWRLSGQTVSFDLADVPLIGQADDSRQVLMALLKLWAENYEAHPSPSDVVWLRYQPKNVMPPSKGDNFVWALVNIDVTPASKEVVEE